MLFRSIGEFTACPNVTCRVLIALYLENEAFAQEMVFVKNVLKWVLLPIYIVQISKFADGPKQQIYQTIELHEQYVLLSNKKHVFKKNTFF